MPLNLDVGDKFPDHCLADQHGNDRSISEHADGQPIFVVFYRGPW